MRDRHASAIAALAFLAVSSGCDTGVSPGGGAPAAAEMLEVVIGGESFELQLALDAPRRYRGLGGRASIDPHGGMLFAFPRPVPLQFVMRDCLVPIDVAFLDSSGRVVALHEMPTEPPRRENEGAGEYEARLPTYSSVLPAQFALETAGGRLRELGLVVGQRIGFDQAALVQRAR